MREKEGVALKAIRWSEIFPWLSIGKSFRLAIGPRPLVFGAAALLLDARRMVYDRLGLFGTTRC